MTGLHHVEEVMGMSVSFDIRAPAPPAQALRDATAWLHHVDDTFSTYKQNSEISRLGRAELTADRATAEVSGVLRRCRELGESTGGAFDAFNVPAPNGTTLDPSGLVKGWSIEVAADLLNQAGATNLCINAGGDIALRGQPVPGRSWRIGIRHPHRPMEQATVVHLTGPAAVATSATYERGAHIIDPRTGKPASDLLSVTVVGPDLGDADAFATAVFVMGLEGLAWIEEQDGYDAFLITADDTTHWTTGFAAVWPEAMGCRDLQQALRPPGAPSVT